MHSVRSWLPRENSFEDVLVLGGYLLVADRAIPCLCTAGDVRDAAPWLGGHALLVVRRTVLGAGTEGQGEARGLAVTRQSERFLREKRRGRLAVARSGARRAAARL